MCEPTITGASDGSSAARVATTLPIASIATSRPRSCIHADDQISSRPVGVGQREPSVAPLAVRAVDATDLAEFVDSPEQSRGVDAELGPCPIAGPISAHRELERGDFGECLTEGVDRLVDQLLTTLGGGRRRVADVTVGTEVVRQPAEPDGTAEPDVPVVGELLGDVARR